MTGNSNGILRVCRGDDSLSLFLYHTLTGDSDFLAQGLLRKGQLRDDPLGGWMILAVSRIVEIRRDESEH